MMRRQTLRAVYRVRGYNGDVIRFSRLLARRHDAFRVARNVERYYERATVERADLSDWVDVEVPEWWTP